MLCEHLLDLVTLVHKGTKAFLVVYHHTLPLTSLIILILLLLILPLLPLINMYFPYLMALAASTMLSAPPRTTAGPSAPTSSGCHTIQKGYFTAIIDHCEC